MDQDDPEQRIAELERRLDDANAAGTEQGAEQLSAPSAAADTDGQYLRRTRPGGSIQLGNNPSKFGRSLRLTGMGGWLATIAVAGIWLYMFGHLVWDAYAYQVGTPATATDVSCRGDANSDDPNVNCSGTWSIAGQSRGPIREVPGSWKFGQSLDVRVHRGTAYAAGSTGWRLGTSLLLAVFLITMSLGGFRAIDRRWRQWHTHRRARR